MTLTSGELRYRKMTETPVRKLILSMCLPTIVSMMVSSFYNMADTYFVSQLGTSASAAVGVVFSLQAIIQAIGFGFGMGASSFISRLLGAKQDDMADRVAITSLCSAAFVALIIAVIGLSDTDWLMRILGATDTIVPYASAYARYILIGAPYMAASFVLNNLLRSEGSAFRAMYGIFAGAVLNIALDPLFIFVFEMGTAGAAIATIISQAVSFIILLLQITKHGANLKLSLKKITLRWSVYREVFKMGSPSFFRQVLNSLASICLNVFAGPFGDFAISASSIVTRVMFFLTSAMLGFGQAYAPVAGYSYGAKKYDRVRDGFWFLVKTGAAVLSVCALVLFVFAPRILTLFRADDAQVIAIGTIMMRLQAVAFPMQVFTICANNLFQSTGKGARAAFLSLARQGLFFIPILIVLTQLIGLTGLQISQALSDTLTFACALPLAISYTRELKRLSQQNAVPLAAAPVEA